MTYELMTVTRCAELCGLGPEEIMLGVSPSATHDSLYDSYLLHRQRGWAGVRDMIVADLRMALDLGAKKHAADLLIVLRRFLSGRVLGEVVPLRVGARSPGASEAGTTHSRTRVAERVSAMRKDAARPRAGLNDGDILYFDVVRRRRLAAACGDH